MSYPRGAYLARVPEEDRALLEQALEWLREEYACEEVIPGPISLLQNRFRIGYNQGLRIAQHLERLRIWKMQDDPEHGRVSTIVAGSLMTNSNANEHAPDGLTESVSQKYVAFCDILGFSSKLANDFDETLIVYRRFVERLNPDLFRDEVAITMYSDAILLTSDSLGPLLSSVQTLWFIALTEDLMLRGGIAYGRYWERRQGNHLMVVSDALAAAVKIEGMVGVPAVVLADDIEISLDYWAARYAHGPFAVPLLHFRDRNIVNPFNLMWGTSAANRCRQLMEQSPAYRQKYLWFLALYDAVWSKAQLVPDQAFREMIEKGIIKWTPPASVSSEDEGAQ